MQKLILLTIYLSISCLGFAQQKPDLPDTIKVRFRHYVMKKYYHQTQSAYVFEVYRAGNLEYAISAPKASYLQYVAINGMPTYDLENDSVNNFILQEYLAGEKKQTRWHILNLGRQNCKLMGKITSDFAVPWLADANKDEKYEIVLRDYTFVNWNADFLNSPYPEIILCYEKDTYHLAMDRMRKDSLTYSLEKAQAIKTKMQVFYEDAITHYPFKANVLAGKPESRWGFISASLWSTMLDLIYAGKSELAWEFLEKSWYEKLEGKAEFLSDFKTVLSQSPYYEELRKMNSSL